MSATIALQIFFLYEEDKMFLFCILEQNHSLAALRVMLSLIQVGHVISIFQTAHKSLFEDKHRLLKENSQTIFQNFGIELSL